MLFLPWNLPTFNLMARHLPSIPGIQKQDIDKFNILNDFPDTTGKNKLWKDFQKCYFYGYRRYYLNVTKVLKEKLKINRTKGMRRTPQIGQGHQEDTH